VQVNPRTLFGGLALLSAILAACAGDAGGEDDRFDPRDANIWPAAVHSGTDGTSFLVPVSTDLGYAAEGEEIAWSIADPALATIAAAGQPSTTDVADGHWALITTAQPGTTRVRATAAGVTIEVPLVIRDYTPEQVEAGRARYLSPDDPGSTRLACAGCHFEGGAPDHSPLSMAAFEDAALLHIIVAGRYPDLCVDADAEPCACDAPGCDDLEPGEPLEIDHAWDLTAAEQDGIIAYMRSLPPAGF
jgi:hypothetical protein